MTATQETTPPPFVPEQEPAGNWHDDLNNYLKAGEDYDAHAASFTEGDASHLVDLASRISVNRKVIKAAESWGGVEVPEIAETTYTITSTLPDGSSVTENLDESLATRLLAYADKHKPAENKPDDAQPTGKTNANGAADKQPVVTPAKSVAGKPFKERTRSVVEINDLLRPQERSDEFKRQLLIEELRDLGIKPTEAVIQSYLGKPKAATENEPATKPEATEAQTPDLADTVAEVKRSRRHRGSHRAVGRFALSLRGVKNQAKTPKPVKHGSKAARRDERLDVLSHNLMEKRRAEIEGREPEYIEMSEPTTESAKEAKPQKPSQQERLDVLAQNLMEKRRAEIEGRNPEYVELSEPTPEPSRRERRAQKREAIYEAAWQAMAATAQRRMAEQAEEEKRRAA